MLDRTQSSEGRSSMRTSIWTRIAITALAGCVVAGLAAPAWGDDVTLRRDGSKAVPIVADLSAKGDAQASNAPVLRRDGSKAEPFVADLDPETGPAVAPAVAADGFDWSDAAIGAGLGAAAVMLAVAGALAMRGRRPLQGRRAAEQA
jgi:hypothetical protein